MPADLLVRPAYLWVPEHASTSGEFAQEIAELAGLTLDPEQRLVLDALLAERADGMWAALEAAIICARQNMKTFLFELVALHDLFLARAEWMRLITWTAHLFRTTQEAFRDLDEMIAGTPAFARKVKRASRANGEEGFELQDGRRLIFLARSKTGGRGLTGDRVILDEAWALTAAEMGSLFPTLSARPNPQVLYGSSAGMVGSAHLRSVRDRGRAGGDPSLVYIEFCSERAECERADRCDHRPGTEGCVVDDEERWHQANPALGRRISLDYLRAERRALPAEEFMRERLGWWDDPAAGLSGIPDEVWNECAEPDSELDEPCTLALDVAPGHVAGSIVACGGALYVADHHKGTSWMVERLTELNRDHDVSGIGIDPAGPAAALIPDLEKAGFTIRNQTNPAGKLVLLNGRESVQACEAFLSGVLDGTLIHRDQHVLNSAVQGAGRRQVGDSWKWSRRDSTVDISPLVAATVARFLWTQPLEPETPDEPSKYWSADELWSE